MCIYMLCSRYASNLSKLNRCASRSCRLLRTKKKSPFVHPDPFSFQYSRHFLVCAQVGCLKTRDPGTKARPKAAWTKQWLKKEIRLNQPSCRNLLVIRKTGNTHHQSCSMTPYLIRSIGNTHHQNCCMTPYLPQCPKGMTSGISAGY